MKKINENELLEKVSKLKEYIAVVESEQQADEGVMDALGKYAAPIGSAIKAGAGKAVNAVQGALGSTAGKVAAGTALGAGGVLAAQKLAGGQAPAPAGTTAKVPGKPNPSVLALQQKLIAAGAKIKADGIMGPATQAAMKQFPQAAGGAPAVPAAAPAADPAAAPAMTAADQEDADMGAAMAANQAQASHDATVASGQPDDATGVDAAVAAQQKPAVAPTATAGTPPPPPGTMRAESVSFKDDELSRIVSLVQYR